ncbi:unnamed protein product, partial [Prorocentrum cordatum]
MGAWCRRNGETLRSELGGPWMIADPGPLSAFHPPQGRAACRGAKLPAPAEGAPRGWPAMAAGPAGAAAAEEQLRQAEAFKAEGNRWYGQEEYRKALGAYHKVFCYVNGLPNLGDRADASEEDKARGESVRKIKQTVRLNMAPGLPARSTRSAWTRAPRRWSSGPAAPRRTSGGGRRAPPCATWAGRGRTWSGPASWRPTT